MRNILVTNALPYANGPIHMGHLLGYIQADIWVRAMRAMGHDVTYVCADDAHGTAIMLRAEANGISPEDQIANVQKEHIRDFDGFGVHFDHYDSTHSDETRSRASEIYVKTAKQAILPSVLSTSFLTLKKACSYRIVSLKARARNVSRKINMAMRVKSEVQNTMQLSF